MPGFPLIRTVAHCFRTISSVVVDLVRLALLAAHSRRALAAENSSYWGWVPSWFGGTVFVNNVFFHRHGFHCDRDSDFNRERWAHNPGHRLGVPYPNRHARCRREIAEIEALIRAGHPDVEGLCLALADWSMELRLITEEMARQRCRAH
jgi:hypothetical protein